MGGESTLTPAVAKATIGFQTDGRSCNTGYPNAGCTLYH